MFVSTWFKKNTTIEQVLPSLTTILRFVVIVCLNEIKRKNQPKRFVPIGCRQENARSLEARDDRGRASDGCTHCGGLGLLGGDGRRRSGACRDGRPFPYPRVFVGVRSWRARTVPAQVRVSVGRGKGGKCMTDVRTCALCGSP